MAQLGCARARGNGDLEVAGGVVERDEHGEPTGVLREEAAWRFKDRYLRCADDEYVEAMRAGAAGSRAARGVTAVHDKDGWLGALRLWQRLEEAGSLTLRVWQSVPHDRVGQRCATLGLRSGLGSPLLRLGYLKVFMDGTLGSRDGADARRLRRRDHERRAARGDRARRRGGRVPGRGPRDRRRREP